MTAAEYDDYEQRVKMFMEREGLSNLSEVVDEASGEGSPDHTMKPCHCCGRSLGMLVEAHGYNPTTEMIHDGYWVCQDCVYYATYGKLDDQTMMEVEKDS